MFAVPGWSLSPKLLKTQNTSAVKIDAAQKPSRTSKKRKRHHGAEVSQEVTTANVGELWSEHIEGMKPIAKTVDSEKRTDFAKSSEDGFRTEKIISAKTKEDNASRKHKQPENKRAKPDKQEAEQANGPRGGQGKASASTKPAKATTAAQAPQAIATQESKLTPLQAAMRQKLISARFRHLNQTLYTAPSSETQHLFETNPTFFEEYHSGFRQQVSAWPENPVDGFVQQLLLRGKIREHKKGGKHRTTPRTDESEPAGPPQTALPRSNGVCTIADLGCGDAKLASQIGKTAKKLHVVVNSYDLQSPNPLVTKADISNLPLANGSVNIAIFCLALMGTNWLDFVDEAWRVLHWKGELWIAEIKSRFGRPLERRVVEHSVGKRRKPNKGDVQKQRVAEEGDLNRKLAIDVDGLDDPKGQTDVSAFVEVLRKRGFALNGENAVDLGNKMFVRMSFVKALPPQRGKNFKEVSAGVEERPGQKRQKVHFLEREHDEDVDETSVLKPCLYKIR